MVFWRRLRRNLLLNIWIRMPTYDASVMRKHLRIFHILFILASCFMQLRNVQLQTAASFWHSFFEFNANSIYICKTTFCNGFELIGISKSSTIILLVWNPQFSSIGSSFAFSILQSGNTFLLIFSCFSFRKFFILALQIRNMIYLDMASSIQGDNKKTQCVFIMAFRFSVLI